MHNKRMQSSVKLLIIYFSLTELKIQALNEAIPVTLGTQSLLYYSGKLLCGPRSIMLNELNVAISVNIFHFHILPYNTRKRLSLF